MDCTAALFRRTIAIYPFLGSVTYRHLQPEPYIARSIDRLAFLSLPRIAKQTKEFSLTPYPRGHSLSRTVPENTIVDRAFDVLPHFSNLNTLVKHSIKSTPHRMAVLRHLRPQVFELEIRGDDLTWQATEFQLSTPIVAQRVFLFNCNANPHQIQSSSNSHPSHCSSDVPLSQHSRGNFRWSQWYGEHPCCHVFISVSILI